jgi:hypothetical protein
MGLAPLRLTEYADIFPNFRLVFSRLGGAISATFVAFVVTTSIGTKGKIRGR